MRTLRLTACLVILPVCMAGCAATKVIPPKTIASVGGQPLPVVTGESGASVAADLPPPPRNARRDARISGRVFDERGEPIADARVRLAVGNAPGGKMISATTDKTGAFTLRGVRPGSSYTVIAEWEDKNGPVSGRSVVEAPDTNVRITLGISDRDSPQAARSAGRKRVSSVSEHDEPSKDGDDADFTEESSGVPRVNEEDLPPATEAEAFAPPRTSRSTPSSSREPSPRIARWRRAGDRPPTAGPVRSPAPDARSEGRAPEDFAPRENSPFATPGAEDDDDGENPLPPALERGQTSRSPAPLADDAVVSAGEPSPLEARPATLAGVPAAVDADPFATTQDAAALEPLPTTTPGASAAAVVADAQDPFAPPAPAAAAEPVPLGALVASPLVSDQSVFETESDQPAPAPPMSFEPAAPPDTRKRPTWKDLSSTSGRSRAPIERAAAPASLPPDARPAAGVASSPGASAPRAAPPGDAGPSFCDYDVKLRRINDFRLPDLQGRPVRFQDLDADLVLLDFWGTWCQPCLRSIPHLVELQKRLGPEKLKVVGITCEQGPVAERTQKVAEQVRRLGINYPVVMSGMDGPCPLQQALKIQAYPTLVLVDRQGRIVWRDQGTTPVTLARLDRFLAMSTGDERVKRY